MRTKLLLLVLLVYSISAISQSVETKYFKESWGKEVKEKKANYKKVISTYDDGVVKSKTYHIKNNRLVYVDEYKDDLPTGIWQEYDKKGNLISERNFDSLVYVDISKIKKDSLPMDTTNYIHATYGSAGDRLNYLQSNIKYPQEAKESGIQGTIYMTFTISKEGDIKDVKILRGVHPFLDYEAYRVIKNMGKWNPATKDGVAVESVYNMPLRFILAG
ncbi:MAG: hypothetical protein DRI84_07255 [Bacteroidetes bacterium]|nr:MAG: hypothetical protein DRI84_07255 [Bacteroidota bacterium]